MKSTPVLRGLPGRTLRRSMAAYARTMGSPTMRRFNYYLLETGMHGLGFWNYESFEISGEANFVNHGLKAFVAGSRPVLLDVGAHDGRFSQLLLAAFPEAKVFAFEPNPTSFDRLEAELGSVLTVVPLGLGETDGSAEIFDYSDNDGSEHASLYRDALDELRHLPTTGHTIEIATLDAWAADAAVTSIDFLKVDTEGGELAVLRGASHLLDRDAIAVVQLEFNEMNVYSRSFLRDILDALPRHEMYRILPTGLMRLHPYNPPLQEIFGFQNLVAIRKDLLPGEPPPWISTR